MSSYSIKIERFRDCSRFPFEETGLFDVSKLRGTSNKVINFTLTYDFLFISQTCVIIIDILCIYSSNFHANIDILLMYVLDRYRKHEHTLSCTCCCRLSS